MGCFDNVDKTALEIANLLDKNSNARAASEALSKCYYEANNRAQFADLLFKVQDTEEPGVGMDLDYARRVANYGVESPPYTIRHAGAPKE